MKSQADCVTLLDFGGRAPHIGINLLPSVRRHHPSHGLNENFPFVRR